MATFFAQYPVNGVSTTTVQTVQGEGTAGAQVGGVLTVQGDPAGTPIPISGTVTAANPSVGITGAAVPADGTYVGMNVAGNLVGITGTASGLNTVINAPIPVGTNSIGNIATVSAVTTITNPVTIGTIAPVTTTTVVWQAEGSLAFGSITSSYQTIFTPSASTKILFMRNNTDVAISVSMDAGTTLNFVLDSGDQIAIDFLSNALVSTTTAIQIKYTVGAPTSGSIRVNGGH